MLIARLIRDMELNPFIPPSSEATSLYFELYFPLIFFQKCFVSILYARKSDPNRQGFCVFNNLFKKCQTFVQCFQKAPPYYK